MIRISDMSDRLFISYLNNNGVLDEDYFEVGMSVRTKGFKKGNYTQTGHNNDKENLGVTDEMIESCEAGLVMKIITISKYDNGSIRHVVLENEYVYYPEYLELV